MRKFLPHSVVFGIAGLTIAFGVIADSGAIGGLIGRVGASIIDPANFILAGVIGGAISRQRILFPSLVSLGVVLAVVIAQMNAALGAELSGFVILSKIVAALLTGYAVNVVRVMISPTAPNKETPS